MAIPLKACKAASSYMGGKGMGVTLFEINKSHIMTKHKDVTTLKEWIQLNPHASPELGDLGLKSYFKCDEGNILLYVMNTINAPDAYFEAPGSNSRALFYRRFEKAVVGTSLGLSDAPLPKGMADPLEVDGVVCVIDVYAFAVVTGFPADRPRHLREIKF